MAGWFRNIVDTVADTASSIGSAVASALAPDPYSTMSGVVPFRDSRLPNIRPDNANYISLSRSISNTVGRYTYQLDKYTKNALLVFHFSSYEGSYNTADDVKDAFKKFRFEVDIYHDLPRYQLIKICEEFFSRDFTEYGAVAIVVIAPAASEAGHYRCKDSTFKNDDILKYYWDNTPPSLKSKPKIFLSQGDNKVIDASNQRPTNLNSEVHHVFELYLPSTLYKNPSSAGSSSSRKCHPLSLICNKLEDLGDKDSFQDIASKVISEAQERWPSTNPENLRPFTTKTYDVMKSLIFWRTS